MMPRSLLPCLVGALITCAAPTRAADVRTVALSGQQAPGMADGATFADFGFSQPVLNDVGQIAFVARLTGGGVDSTNNRGVWSEGSGSLALVAREGSHAPGTPGGITFSDLDGSFGVGGPPVLNNAGQTAFQAHLRDSEGNADLNDRGIWSEGSGSLALVARTGDHAPGMADGVNYGGFFVLPPMLNDAGQIAFFSYLRGSGVDGTNNASIWSQRSGGVALVVRTGDPAPGTPIGVTYELLLKAPEFNNAGHTAFWGSLTGSGVDATNDQGLWTDRSGSLALLFRSGSQAPGMPGGTNFLSLGGLTLNDAGQIAFRSFLTGVGVDETNDRAIWSERAGGLALVAREGSQAPGTPDGTSFRELDRFTLNNAGQSALMADLTGSGVDVTNDSGIWSERSGALSLVVREGTQAPGLLAGVTFKSFGNSALNDAGQTVFSATVAGIGVDETNNEGIWGTDRAGVLQLIAHKGQSIEVAPGEFRTIDGVYFDPGGFSGNSDGFNNLGHLAFWAGFTDGSSGIFVSNRVAVPEPSTLALAAVAMALLVFRGVCRQRAAERR